MASSNDPIKGPAVADASKCVLHLGEGLDDHRLYAEFGHLNMLASEQLPQEQLESVEAFADLRFEGQSNELTVRAYGADRAGLEQAFRDAYAERYGHAPAASRIEIVTLRLRRIGRAVEAAMPENTGESSPPA